MKTISFVPYLFHILSLFYRILDRHFLNLSKDDSQTIMKDFPKDHNLRLLPSPKEDQVYRDGTLITPGDVWVWGFGGPSSPLGVPADRDGHVCFPQRVPKLKNIVFVSASNAANFAVTVSGAVYSWGKNYKGRLLQPVEDSIINEPTIVEKLKGMKVKTVNVCESHSCALLEDGTALLWGSGMGGCLGDGDTSNHTVYEPLEVVLENDSHILISQVCVTFKATLLLLGDGSVFVAGDNSDHKLGIDAPFADTFTRLDIPPARYISLGSVYSLVTLADSTVLAFGVGSYGNLGIGRRVKYVAKPTPIELPPNVLRARACVGQPSMQSSAKDAEGNEGPTSFAVTTDGHVYAFDTCYKGKMGNCSAKVLCLKKCDYLAPHQIGFGNKSSDEKKVTHYFEGDQIIDCLNSHINSTALGASGKIYSFGCGSDGRMGLDGFIAHERKNRLKFYKSQPTPIETFERENVFVTFFASSRNHSICIGSKRSDC